MLLHVIVVYTFPLLVFHRMNKPRTLLIYSDIDGHLIRFLRFAITKNSAIVLSWYLSFPGYVQNLLDFANPEMELLSFKYVHCKTYYIK